MSTVNQLLAKAMSTSSDDEALACLKMARKKGNSLELNSVEYNGQTAQYWYDKAVSYYNVAKKKQDQAIKGLTEDQQKTLYNMYTNAETEKSRLQMSVMKLQSENRQLKAKLDNKRNEYTAGLILGVTIVSVISFVIIAIL